MPVGCPIPRIRVPALTNGNLVTLDISQFKGQWVTLCCPSHFGLVECLFLDRYRKEWEQQGALLLGLVSGTYPFHEPWIQQVPRLGLPLLSDPLGRVCRALKLSKLQELGRCHSLIINPRGIVEYHLIHDLSVRGMNAISEIFLLSKKQRVGPGSQSKPAAIGDFPVLTQVFPADSGPSRSGLIIGPRNECKIKEPHPVGVQE
ncbi:MAG: redoxin domain-containing protein [Nitrospirales bacterium]